MGIRITDRDRKIIDFVGKNPCFGETLCSIFFSATSYVTASHRLMLLAEHGYINRYREGYGCPYFYFLGTKCPKQQIHLDLIAKCYVFLENTHYKVLSWNREVTLKNGIRPDVITDIKDVNNGRTATLYIEVERYNNSLLKKIEKYEEIYRTVTNDFAILYVCDDKFSKCSCCKINQLTIEVLKSFCK